MLRLRTWILVLIPVSVMSGIVLTNIPWGDPDGFHGTGFPFAAVYWDRAGDSKQLIDYPNPYAALLNSAVLFVVGSLVIAAGRWFAGWRLHRR